MRRCVWSRKPREGGGLSPIWAAAPKLKKRYKHDMFCFYHANIAVMLGGILHVNVCYCWPYTFAWVILLNKHFSFQTRTTWLRLHCRCRNASKYVSLEARQKRLVWALIRNKGVNPRSTLKKERGLSGIFSNFLFVVCFLLGNSPASEFYMPAFRNTLSVPSS